MKESSRTELVELLKSLEAEADPLADKLENSHRQISKLRENIDNLKSYFSEDDFVFSPRSDRSSLDEINKQTNDLEQLEQEELELQQHYQEINDHIDSLVSILAAENTNSSNITVLQYQEQDRLRIARDLHDSSLQSMAYLVGKLDQCAQYIDSDPMKAKMELSIAQQSLKDSIDGIRSIIYDLRPMIMDSVGFRSSLDRLLQLFNQNNEYKLIEDIENVSCENQMILISIYRIIEECLQNIRLHAEAFQIHIILQEQTGYYYLYIEDDGKGFSLNEYETNHDHKFGISIMKERVQLLGGSIYIDTSVNGGTKIKVLIPSI